MFDSNQISNTITKKELLLIVRRPTINVSSMYVCDPFLFIYISDGQR